MRRRKKIAAAKRPETKARMKPRTRKPVSELLRELKNLRSARSRLERRLTELVQEIGVLRHYELRAKMLEAELRKRDEELQALRPRDPQQALPFGS